MNLFENLNISLSYSPLYFVLGIIILMLYTIYIYRTTLPEINNVTKIVLITLRSLSLVSILVLIFDPLIKISTNEKVEPINLIFVDNSKSIQEYGSKEDLLVINDFIAQVKTNLTGNNEVFTFGTHLNLLELQKDSLRFNESSTQLNSILSKINETDRPASIVIISDGIFNENKNAERELSKLSTPIYTVGIGDSTQSNDVIIDQIRTNNFIYSGKETDVELVVRNSGGAKTQATVHLYDDNSLINTNTITLSETGINRIRIPYKTDRNGRHKISARIISKLNEKNLVNNYLSQIINVSETKKKIAILAGSPSRDLSYIINAVTDNKDYDITTIIQLSRNKFYKNNSNLELLKNADILFLIGFPNTNSDDNFIKEVVSIIKDQQKPYFFAFSTSIDFIKMRQFQNILPYKISSINNSFDEVLVKKENSENGILGKSEDLREKWNNLPPVSLTRTSINPAASSEILLSVNSGESRPLIFSNRLMNPKSIVVTSSNIWRWKLNSSNNDYDIFSNFINNSIKWLGSKNDNDIFTVSTFKSNFKIGEPVLFSGRLYSETQEPINNALIKVVISNDSNRTERYLNSIGNGQYELNYNFRREGLYNYTAFVEDNSLYKRVSGSINIDPIEIEFVEQKMNKNFLKAISMQSGGNYFEPNQISNLNNELNFNYQNKIYFNKIDKELRLSSFELILLLLVLLFSIEWIIRKIFRMI